MYRRGHKDIGRYYPEEDYHSPEQHLVEQRMLLLQVVPKHIARQGYQIGVGLRGVAPKDDPPHQHTQRYRTEAEIWPLLVSAEEYDDHQTYGYKLDDTIVVQHIT